MSRDIHIINYDHIFLKHIISKYVFHRSLFIRTLPNFASQDTTFFGRVIYRDRGNQPTNPPKKQQITGHRTGSGEWFGFLSSGCRVLAWRRYRVPPYCWVCFGLLVLCIKRGFFWKEGYGLLVQYPKYASMDGKLIFPIYVPNKLRYKCKGRYCTHGAFIWLLMTWNTCPTKSSWRVAVFIEMSLEDLRRWWWWAFFLQIRWRAISKTSNVKMIIFEKTSSSRTSNTKPWGVSVQNDEKVSPRCFKTGIFWGYTTVRHRLCRTNLMLSWCLFRFSLINSFLLWHCEIGVFICI